MVAGSASQKLAPRLAGQLKCKLIVPEIKRFPDGELYIRMPGEVKQKHVFIVQSTCYPQNDNLMELLLLLDLAKNLGARKITAVVPYLAYARQDKRFKPGEAISIKTVSKLIARAGADELITVDVHESRSKRDFSIPLRSLTAMPLLGMYLKKMKLKNPAVLGADQGSENRAQIVASKMGADADYLEKKRLTPTKVVSTPKKLDVRGRDVVIVDDIISTGGTVVEAAKILKSQGARDIYAACTHAVLAGNATRILKAAGIKKIIATDTIEREVSLVSVAPLIAHSLG